MAKLLICEHCSIPIDQSESQQYESTDSTTGEKVVHYVCGPSCLTEVFNKHHSKSEKDEALFLSKISLGDLERPQHRTPLDD